MTRPRMHAGEFAIDVPLVRRLLAGQFPEWAALPLEPVESAGTDNAIFRLGDALAVRLPRLAAAAPKMAKEHRWLPALAPRLPLAVPEPLALGAPAEGYPWPWLVYRWVPGRTPAADALEHSVEAAWALGEFARTLRGIDATGAPAPGPENNERGAPLASRDASVRRWLAAAEGFLDIEAATRAWEAAVRAPPWAGRPVWVHGDLLPGNLLVDARDRLTGVVDFGTLAAGDPAADVLPAWAVFSGAAREAYRRALDVDEPTWARGRGWAIAFAVAAIPYYHETNPALAEIARRTLDAVLAEA